MHPSNDHASKGAVTNERVCSFCSSPVLITEIYYATNLLSPTAGHKQ